MTRTRSTHDSRASLVGTWLFAVVVPGSALALGSVPSEVLVVVSTLAAVACTLLWWTPDAGLPRASRGLLWGLGLLLAMTVIQAVPLPAAMCHWLAPANAEIWERALSPLREPGPAWHSLSVAPRATQVEVLRGFFYGCAFLSALRIASREHGERFLVRLVVMSSALMAISALAHMAVGAERVFGIYMPRELQAYRPGRLAPLLNTNHLAAYLNVGACVSLGALVSRRSMPRALSASVALVLVATSVWQGSRGAVGTLAFGMLLTIALTVYTKRRSEGARAELVVLSACGVAAAVTVSIVFSDVARVHLLSRDLTKVDVARESLRLVAQSPWFGVGRGAFETVFSSVHESVTYNTFTNPEDLPIQWLVEWGVPTTVAGLALLGWALRPQVLLRSTRPHVGVWVAIVVTFLHELVDYHLETPGVVVLVAVCAAVVVSNRGRSRREAEASTASAGAGRYGAFVLVAGSILAAAFALPGVGHSLAEDRRTLSELAVDRSVSAERFGELERAALLRHPAEPFVPFMGAVRMQFADEGSVVPWVGRALERNPHFGRAHFVLARSLSVGHAAQARLEYRLAYANDERLRYPIAKEAVRIVFDADSALELVPEGSAGVELLEALAVSLAPRLPSTAVLLDEELERRTPGAAGPALRRAEAAVADATGPAPWCAAGRSCMVEATTAAEMLVRRDPTNCRSHMFVARLRVADGNAVRGLDELEKAIDTASDRAECQRQLIALAMETGQKQRAELALDQLVRGGCGLQEECVTLYGWAAEMEERGGHYVRAVRLYRQVLEIRPEREDLLQHIGELGAREGLLAEGLDAYRTLASRHPSDPQWPAKIAELRARTGSVRRPPDPPSGP